MKKYIAVTTEVRADIIKAFKVDRKTVNNALSFRLDSPLCRRLRKFAMQKGGVVMVAAEEMECIFDSEGNMTQLFPNGAIMEINKKTGHADVYMNGEVIIHVDDIHAREIEALQQSAMALK